MELARERGVVQGRKMRVDTTVVETNIHYPTDSALLGDGARVLTRTMKKVEKAAGGLKKRIRDRMRTVQKQEGDRDRTGWAAEGTGGRRTARRRGTGTGARLTRKIVHQAEGVLEEIEQLPRPRRRRLKTLPERLVTMTGRVRQVVRQTRRAYFQGITVQLRRWSVFSSRIPKYSEGEVE